MGFNGYTASCMNLHEASFTQLKAIFGVSSHPRPDRVLQFLTRFSILYALGQRNSLWTRFKGRARFCDGTPTVLKAKSLTFVISFTAVTFPFWILSSHGLTIRSVGCRLAQRVLPQFAVALVWRWRGGGGVSDDSMESMGCCIQHCKRDRYLTFQLFTCPLILNVIFNPLKSVLTSSTDLFSICGDFVAHNPYWGNDRLDSRGR